MNPYYSDDLVTIYHGDAREVLPSLAPKSVDLVVTDPPYGVSWKSGTRRATPQFDVMSGDDGDFDPKAILGLALRALRQNRHAYVFGRADLSGLRVSRPVELVWAKRQPNAGNLSLPWGPAHEIIQFVTRIDSAANLRDGYGVGAARLRKGSVISVPRLNSRQVKRHPTEKPVRLLRILIESSSTFDEMVLDPFMGSGSTLEAALLEGRRAIGIEIEERYCEIAATRCSQEVLGLAV